MRLLNDTKTASYQNKNSYNPIRNHANPSNDEGSQAVHVGLIQKKQVDASLKPSEPRRTFCIELSLDFYRFHIFGSLAYLCKKKDSTFFFVQLLVTVAYYLFLLFVLANLVSYKNLVWTEAWTVAVSIIVSLVITLIVMMTINYRLLSYQLKQPDSFTLNQALLQAQPNEEDLEALEFTHKSQRCGIFDFIGVLMVIVFFILGIVAAYDLWFLSGTEAGWVLLSFLITIIVDLFLLRPLSITIVATVRATYFKSVDPTGAEFDLRTMVGSSAQNNLRSNEEQGGLNDGDSTKIQNDGRKLTTAAKTGHDLEEKDLTEVKIVTNEDGTKLVEGGIEAYAIMNNDPKAKNAPVNGKVEATGIIIIKGLT